METLDIKTAIQIAKILSAAPEERLPMILGVFEKAEITIEGLTELEEWKALNRPVAMIDIQQFRADLIKDREATGEEIRIKVQDFNDFCKQRKVSNRLARKTLYEHDMIRTCMDKDKVSYTIPMTDPETKQISRFVVIKN